MMPEWLRDPVWQFIGAIIGLLALLAVCTVAVWQRSRKLLRYSLFFDKIISGPIDPDFEVLYRGRPIENIWSGTLTFLNAGNQPIRREDFDELVGLKVYEGTLEFLTAKITSTEPADIPAKIAWITNTEFRLEPVLLNPGDTINLRILATNMGSTDVVGRVVGVKRIQEIDYRARTRAYAVITIVLSMSIGLLSGYAAKSVSLTQMKAGLPLWVRRVVVVSLVAASLGVLTLLYRGLFPVIERVLLLRQKRRK